jgi:hypothetical protein
MTCFNAAISAREVDVVWATASGVDGFFGAATRGGTTGVAGTCGEIGEVALADDWGAGSLAIGGGDCGTTLRGIGRGFGSGTAHAAAGSVNIAPAVASNAIRRDRHKRADGVTAFPGGESSNSCCFRCISLIVWTKR